MLVAPDDPGAPDVRALLETHLALMRATSPPQDVHALDVDALRQASVAFFSCRADGGLLGVGALTTLTHDHGEVKSMHTAAAARGRGVARLLLSHLLATAHAAGMARVSLETGVEPVFAPARAMYTGAGFVECGPFGAYEPSPNSTFMTLAL